MVLSSQRVIPSFDKTFPVLEHRGNPSSLKAGTTPQLRSNECCCPFFQVNPKDLRQQHIFRGVFCTPVK